MRMRATMAAALLCTAFLLYSGPTRAAGYREVATPRFRTRILAFEDTFQYPVPPQGGLIYRIEGDAARLRMGGSRSPGLGFLAGQVSCIHPAQYTRATLRVWLRIDEGEPSVAISHNGMCDTAGHTNDSPGLQVALRQSDTLVRDLKTGSTLAALPVALPRHAETVVVIAWDHAARSMRVTLCGRSFVMAMPLSVRRGGFALAAPAEPATRYVVRRAQVFWEDARPLVLYDGYDTVYDLHGRKLGKLPPAALPEGMTSYSMTSYDLRGAHALLVYGGPDLSSDHPETVRGFAVRDLATGRLHLLGERPNGCLPMQGGGGIDGLWLLQSWNPPASTCWVDWNAWDRDDMVGFIRPFQTAEIGEGTWTAFHDPANALDGSMARYLRITESWRGVNHVTVHPDLLPFAPFADVAFPPPTHPLVSHTGPAGMPTQLAVRDRDRAWYEQWAFLGNGLHVQCRGYNLFTQEDDWHGPFYAPEKDAEPCEDFVNMMPDLRRSGRVFAPFMRFSPTAPPEGRIVGLATYWARVGPDGFIPETQVAGPTPWIVPYQMLLDISLLLPADEKAP